MPPVTPENQENEKKTEGTGVYYSPTQQSAYAPNSGNAGQAPSSSAEPAASTASTSANSGNASPGIAAGDAGTPISPDPLGTGASQSDPFGAGAQAIAPAPEMTATASSPFQMSLRNLWDVQVDLWLGRVPSAFRRTESIVATTGVGWVTWLVPFLASSIAFGLFLAGAAKLVVAVVAEFVNKATYGLVNVGVPFSVYFKLFLFGAIFFFVVMLVRSVVVLLTHRVSGGTATFQESATQVGIGITLFWLPLLIGFLFNLLSVPILNVIVAICVVALIIMSEIVIYIGISRRGPHKRSPVTAYAWMTVGSLIVSGILAVIFIAISVLSMF